MVVPIVSRKRKEAKSFLQRSWFYILGACFIAIVITVTVVTIITGINVFTYLNETIQ